MAEDLLGLLDYEEDGNGEVSGVEWLAGAVASGPRSGKAEFNEALNSLSNLSDLLIVINERFSKTLTARQKSQIRTQSRLLVVQLQEAWLKVQRENVPFKDLAWSQSTRLLAMLEERELSTVDHLDEYFAKYDQMDELMNEMQDKLECRMEYIMSRLDNLFCCRDVVERLAARTQRSPESLINVVLQEMLSPEQEAQLLAESPNPVEGHSNVLPSEQAQGEFTPLTVLNRTVGMHGSELYLSALQTETGQRSQREQWRQEVTPRRPIDPQTRQGQGSFAENVENMRADESVCGDGRGQRENEPISGAEALFTMGLANSLLATLPPLSKYSCKTSENFEEFVEGLSLRFIPGYSEAQKLMLFRNYLRDDSRALYEALPATVKSEGFDSVVREFKKQMEGPLSLKRIHWQRELSLFGKKAVNVTEVCREIESLGRKAYPSEAEKQVREAQQSAALLRCLESRDNFHQYLDESLKEDQASSAYNLVKTLALRHDSYVRSSTALSSQSVQKKHRQSSPKRFGSSSGGPPFNKSSLPKERSTTSSGFESNRQRQNYSGVAEGRRNFEQHRPVKKEDRSWVPTCHNCRKRGHLRAECPSRRAEAMEDGNYRCRNSKNSRSIDTEQVVEKHQWLPKALVEELLEEQFVDNVESVDGRDTSEAEFKGGVQSVPDSHLTLMNTQKATVMTPGVDRYGHGHSGKSGAIQNAKIVWNRTGTGSLEKASVQELRPIALPIVGDTFRAEQLMIKGLVAYKEAEVTVDTGASISLVSTGFLQAAQADMNVSRKMCEEDIKFVEGKAEDYSILDASRNLLNLIGQCVLPVKLGDGTVTRVGFHVIRRNEQQVLLGMNALRAVGITILLNCPGEDTEVKLEETVRLTPGASRIIPLKGVRKDRILLLEGTPGVDTDSVLRTDDNGRAFLRVTNNSSSLIALEKGITFKATEDFEVIEWDELEVASPLKEEGGKCELLNIPNAADKQKQSRSRDARVKEILTCLHSNGMPQMDSLTALIADNEDIFAMTDEELGRTNVVEHSIQTGDAKPIRQRARPVPLGIQGQVKDLLVKMKNQGIIKHSSSPWSSPCVLVKKKDGSIRMCVDFRKVNEVMKQDAQPLPNMNLTLQRFSGKKVFSTFDLVSGFWQIPLSEESKERSAFAILDGLYEFQVMPYGLCNAPATFQRAMHLVLEDLLGENVQVYVDDILVASDSWEEHVVHLQQVFEKLRNSGFKLKVQKCSVGKSNVHFLGHIIGVDGVKVDPDKIVKIQRCERPTSLTELRTFLGMCNYYRKFILNFSRIASPLYDLTSSNVKWYWLEAQEKAFQALKLALSTTPVLAQPDVEAARDGSRPLIIYVDASKQGVGAVLSQEDKEGRLHPLHFMSERLNEAQKKYHPTDLEALAVKRAVEKFRQYIYGLPVVVKTDHQALVALLKRPNLAERTMRWAMELQDENLRIEYVKGSANKVADALSRGPVVLSECTEMLQEEKLDRVVGELVPNEIDEWTRILETDPGYKAFVQNSEAENWDESVVIESNSGNKVADFVLLDNKLFFVHHDGRLRRWVPEKFRKDVWQAAHESRTGGHGSVEVSLRKISAEYFWPKMRADFKHWSRGCVKCLTGNPRTTNVPELHPRVVSAAFHTVGVDLVDMGTGTLSGNRYMLTIIDYFTKFAYAEALPSKEAGVVSAALFGYLLRECRVPRVIVSDQGREFMNDIAKTACEELDISWEYSKGYIKRETGMIERFNRSIEQILRKIVVVETEWDVMIPFALYAYNSAQHSSTGESPIFLAAGRDANLLMKGISRNRLNLNSIDVQTYKTDMLAGLQVAHEATVENLGTAAHQMKQQFDKRRPKCTEKIVEGDRVILYEMNPVHKLENKFSGPYRVVKVQKTSVVLKDLVNKTRETFPVQLECVRKVPVGMKEFDLQKKSGRQGRKANVAVRQENETKTPVRRSARLQRCELLYFSSNTFTVKRGDPLHPETTLEGVTVGDVGTVMQIFGTNDLALTIPLKRVAELLGVTSSLTAASSLGEVSRNLKDARFSVAGVGFAMKVLSKKSLLAGETIRALMEAEEVRCEDDQAFGDLLMKYASSERSSGATKSEITASLVANRKREYADNEGRVTLGAVSAVHGRYIEAQIVLVGDVALRQVAEFLLTRSTRFLHLEGINWDSVESSFLTLIGHLGRTRGECDAKVVVMQVGYELLKVGVTKILERLKSYKDNLPGGLDFLVVPALKGRTTETEIDEMKILFSELPRYGFLTRSPRLNETAYFGESLANTDASYHRNQPVSATKVLAYARFVRGVDTLFKRFAFEGDLKKYASVARFDARKERSGGETPMPMESPLPWKEAQDLEVLPKKPRVEIEELHIEQSTPKRTVVLVKSQSHHEESPPIRGRVTMLKSEGTPSIASRISVPPKKSSSNKEKRREKCYRCAQIGHQAKHCTEYKNSRRSRRE